MKLTYNGVSQSWRISGQTLRDGISSAATRSCRFRLLHEENRTYIQSLINVIYLAYSFDIRYFLPVIFLLPLFGCNQAGSEVPFPVDTKKEWRRYLQGDWVYSRADSIHVGNGFVSADSSSYQLSFAGDSLEVLRKNFSDRSVIVDHASCKVRYSLPSRVDIESCNRARKYRVWLQDVYHYERGDTTYMHRSTMASGSPESRSLTKDISEFIPTLRTESRDSLRVVYGNGNSFYLARKTYHIF